MRILIKITLITLIVFLTSNHAAAEFPETLPNDEFVDPEQTGEWLRGLPGFPEREWLWALKRIQADRAWNLAQGEGVTVAVIDTGINIYHPDLTGNLWINQAEAGPVSDVNGDGCPGDCNVDDDGDGLVDEDSFDCGRSGFNRFGFSCEWRNDLVGDDDENGFADDQTGWNFLSNNGNVTDDFGHGTKIAGIIAATGNDSYGMIGIAPRAKIMTLKVGDANTRPSSGVISAAIHYAIDNGASLINISSSIDLSEVGIAPLHYRLAVQRAALENVLIVCSTPNAEIDASASYPANDPTTLAVAGTNFDDQRRTASESENGSSFGPTIDLRAPSIGLLAPSHPSGAGGVAGYLVTQGNSFATPLVTGVAALILERNPEVSAGELRSALINSVDRNSNIVGMGSGRINAFMAARYVANSVRAPYHNVSNPYDVNRDGLVNPRDVLLVINSINGAPGPGELVAPDDEDQVAIFFDVTGDNRLNPRDVLYLINYINERAEAEGEGNVAEPFLRVEQVSVNEQTDHLVNLPTGNQPTSWKKQRSLIRSIGIKFNTSGVRLLASDITLVHLGKNPGVDTETQIDLQERDLLTIDDDVTTVVISFEGNPLPDGAYRIEVRHIGLETGQHLEHTNATNKLYQLRGDWNGDFGVSMFDFGALAYWFGQVVDVAPAYMDLNEDGGISIFDFSIFRHNFGSTLQLPDAK